jgi:DNA-binding SARP family transcriptional activator
MLAMLQLKLFGTGQARYADRDLPGFPNQQPYLLLCYLLLNRHQPHPREHLAAVFWGEYPTRTSRKYLRNALWRLRHLLQSAGAPADAYLVIHDEYVSFAPSGPCMLDVEAFETMATRFQNLSGRQLTSEQADQLEQAMDLYSGELLTGVYEDWCLYEREHLNLLRLNTLSKLMVFHELNGTYEQGLMHGRRILASDNTRERVHRRMMRLYWQSGNRSAALAQYKLCAQILNETLGIVPLEETTHLYQRMKHGHMTPEIDSNAHRTRLTVGSSSPESAPVLVEQALQRLHELQTIIQQASTELLQIEQQLTSVLPKSLESQSPIQNWATGGD